MVKSRWPLLALGLLPVACGMALLAALSAVLPPLLQAAMPNTEANNRDKGICFMGFLSRQSVFVVIWGLRHKTQIQNN